MRVPALVRSSKIVRRADTKLAVLNHLSILTVLLVCGMPAQAAIAQQAKKGPFWSEIRAFVREDKTVRPTPCQTMFVGSSSIRLWTSLKRDLPQRSVVRRGFGGAHLNHVVRYFDHLITPHQPREIVLYAGENDIAWGRSPTEVATALEAFLERKTETLGVTPVYFISIKPTMYHWDKRATQKQANALIRMLAERRSDLVYIDVASVMLDGGRPKDIFLGDKLHMNREGYRLWTKAVGDALNQHDIPVAPHCEP
ncbi:MAG: GDSL-type esterase/lipase family protein [Pseudomonadota bacterium]